MGGETLQTLFKSRDAGLTIGIGVCAFLATLALVGYRIFNQTISDGSDYRNYLNHYAFVEALRGIPRTYEIGYELLEYLGVLLGLTGRQFLVLIFLIQALSLGLAYTLVCRRISDSGSQARTIGAITAVLATISPFSWSLFVVIIRQGLALPFSILALHFLFDSKYGRAIVAGLLACSFHYSSFAFLAAGGLIHMLTGSWRLTLLTAVSYPFAIADRFWARIGFKPPLPTPESDVIYQSGIRLDFWIFSLVPFLALLFAARSSPRGMHLLKLYSASFLPFLVVGTGAFVDRILIQAWLLLPIVYGFVFASLLSSIRMPSRWLLFVSTSLSMAIAIVHPLGAA